MGATKNFSKDVGSAWKQYAANTPVDCIADAPAGVVACARRIVLLAAGDLSPCRDADDNNRALTGLPSGYIHEAHVKTFTCTAACIVYW